MAGVFNNFAVGYRESVYLTEETTFGTPVHPAATDAVQFMTGSFEFAHERANRSDKTASRSYRERLTRRKSATFQMQLYLLPSGTNGTAPDVALGLKNGFGVQRTVPDTAIAVSTSATTFGITATHGLNYQLGDPLGWENAAGDTEVSFISNISTDTITVSPAFSGTPQATDVLKGGIVYKLGNTLAPLTVTRVLDNFVDVFTGMVVNEVALEFPGDGEGMLTLSGLGKTAYSSGSSTTAAAVSNVATVIEVPTGEAARFDINTRLQIEDEVVLVTGVDLVNDELTVTRAQAGTVAVAHNTVGTQIGPYEPPQTTAGSPVTGTLGEFIITGPAGARDVLQMMTASVNINNQIGMRNNVFGYDSATGFFNTARRECSFSVTMWLEKHFAKRYNDAKRFIDQEILIQLGKEQGRIVAVLMRQAEFNIPPVNGGGDEEVTLPITGMALASSANNDEVVLAFL